MDDIDNELQTLGGREYYANSKIAYLMPKDADETDRLVKQHTVLKYNLQGNFKAPLSKELQDGIVVLDSGCGPATWTFDMAKEFPNSKFHGVDITPLSFPEGVKPDNCEFQVANIAEHIPYPDNTFDYIHQRLLVMGLTHESWDNTLKEMFRVLKPGGYIELHEPNFVKLRNTGPFIQQLHNTISGMLESRQIPADIALQLDDRVSNAGFDMEQIIITPMAINHKNKAGCLLWEDYRHAYMNIRPLMSMQNPDWESIEAYELHMDACGQEAKERKTCLNWYTYVAQKPLK
ncbi:hypothetical protein PS15m_007706 [Mucor circinelloides]